MADAKTEQEPSIEEILESIRQIISEDGTPDVKQEVVLNQPAAEPQQPAYQPPPEPPKASAQSSIDDIFDLTDKVETPPLDLRPEPPRVEPPAKIEMVETAPPSLLPDHAEALMSDQTAVLASDAISKLLAGNMAIEHAASVGHVGKVTLEDIARDLMKPVIKSWIDQNLPRIVEALVQKELEKLSRRALDR
jgi:hypothetical protein